LMAMMLLSWLVVKLERLVMGDGLRQGGVWSQSRSCQMQNDRTEKGSAPNLSTFCFSVFIKPPIDAFPGPHLPPLPDPFPRHRPFPPVPAARQATNGSPILQAKFSRHAGSLPQSPRPVNPKCGYAGTP
jgi:hypothetical protein